MNKSNHKIALLTTNAGGGHMQVAKSIQIYFASKGVSIQIVNIYTEILGSKDEDIYNKILKYNLSCLYWPVFVKLFRLKLFILRLHHVKLFRNFFFRHNFKLIISIVPFFNSVISEASNHSNSKFIIIPTDLYTPYPKYWFANADAIFTCTEKLAIQARKFGANNIVDIKSLPLRNGFYNLKIKNNSLELLPEKEHTRRLKILIMYGKTPPNYLFDVINNLISISGIELSIICGKNTNLYNKCSKISGLKVYDYVDEIQEVMAWSDIIVTKPGSTTVVESMACNKYIMLEFNHKTMKQELYNVEFVTQQGAGDTFKNMAELLAKISRLHENLPKLNIKIENPLPIIYKHVIAYL